MNNSSMLAYLIGAGIYIFLIVITILMWINTNKLVENTKCINKNC